MSQRTIGLTALLLLVVGCAGEGTGSGRRPQPRAPEPTAQAPVGPQAAPPPAVPVVLPSEPTVVEVEPAPLATNVEPAHPLPIRRSAAEDSVEAVAVEVLLRPDHKLVVDPAEGRMPSVRRQIRLMVLERGKWETTSTVLLPHLIGNQVLISSGDLPGHPRAVIIETRRDHGIRRGAVAVEGDHLIPLDYYGLIAPDPEVRSGVYLQLNKYLNELWVYRGGTLVAMFPTANGRDPLGSDPTWSDFKTNYKTPEGRFLIKQKIVDPAYRGFGSHPPADGGAPNNPLGTRWIGFEGLPGDGGGIWAFHGTYVPEQIGTWASEGCVRLNTADAERLFELVPLNATLRVVSGL